MDDLRARHRKEAKELQAIVTSKRKNASKKTRKGVNDECATLEAQLKERQATELAALDGPADDAPNDEEEDEQDQDQDQGREQEQEQDLVPEEPTAQPNNPTDIASPTKSVHFSSPSDDKDTAPQPSTAKKRNRQKERLARRAAEQEAVAAQAAAEAASMPDLRKAERARLLEEFGKRHLAEKAVAANGHCLYASIADQLKLLDLSLVPGEEQANGQQVCGASDEYRLIRRAAADYIQRNPDDFVAFLEEPLADYIDKIRDTGEWGGQLELMALAKTYKIDINVLQAEGRVERIEGWAKGAASGEHLQREAWLAYYRHGFGLGEHYNSLRPDKTAATVVDT